MMAGCALVVERKTRVRFPRAGEEGREELEAAVKRAGIWEEVSSLDVRALERIWEGREEDRRLERGLKGFVREIEIEEMKFLK